jgi:hypothetical protein
MQSEFPSNKCILIFRPTFLCSFQIMVCFCATLCKSSGNVFLSLYTIIPLQFTNIHATISCSVSEHEAINQSGQLSWRFLRAKSSQILRHTIHYVVGYSGPRCSTRYLSLVHVTILERNASIDHTQCRRVGEVADSTVYDAENYDMATRYP